MRDSDFYDKVYDAWRSGYNPDSVSEDMYDDCRSRGYAPDEISWEDVYNGNTKRETTQ